MLENNPNLIKYNEKIFHYPNFVSKELLEKINKIAYSFEMPDASFNDHVVDWYQHKMTPPIPELREVWNNLSELFYPEYVLQPDLKLQTIRPGDNGMFVHADSPGRGNQNKLKSPDTWNICCNLEFGMAVYFGDFTGGETFYPDLDIEIAPKPGDLIIHGATEKWKHGVREVTSGVRFAYSNFATRPEDNPGTFYNYGTKEHEELQTNDPIAWCRPVNNN